MQLYVKAVLLQVAGETARTHELRALLGLLARRLREAGFASEAEAIERFVAENRGQLIAAEEAYILARYSELSYERSEAEALVRLAERLLGLLDGVVRRVLGLDKVYG